MASLCTVLASAASFAQLAELHQPPDQVVNLTVDMDDGRTRNDLANPHEAHHAFRVTHERR